MLRLEPQQLTQTSAPGGEGATFHNVAILELNAAGLIGRLTEYYCAEEQPPEWRQELRVARPLEPPAG